MTEFASMESLVRGLIDSGAAPAGVPAWVHQLLAMLIFGGIVVFGFVLPIAGITTWVERRVMGRIQSRIGPNRVGPLGFLQWLADGVKNMLKEDIVPSAADGPLFRAAPYVVMTGFVGSFAAIPFAGSLIIADLNVGILYITAVTALVVVGILMAGWASNNKWSLLGGIRSAAQIVSYEIPAGLSIFPIVMLAGTLSMQGIIRAQGAAPWTWYLFDNPFTFVAFFVLFVSALAEGNRTPFDLPEAESELVAGFATEYSGMRNLLFFMAEWGNLYVIGAIATTLFLGGWQIPVGPGRPPRAAQRAPVRGLLPQVVRLRRARHLAALDAAAHPRRSDDGDVLEVSRADRAGELPGHGDLDGPVSRRRGPGALARSSWSRWWRSPPSCAGSPSTSATRGSSAGI